MALYVKENQNEREIKMTPQLKCHYYNSFYVLFLRVLFVVLVPLSLTDINITTFMSRAVIQGAVGPSRYFIPNFERFNIF